MHRVSSSTVREILKFHKQGLNTFAISKATGVSYPTAKSVIFGHGLIPNARQYNPTTFTRKMKLDPTKAKRVEIRRATPSSRPYKVFVFDCIGEGCEREILATTGSLYTATGKCSVCAARSRPYQHIYTSVKLCAKHRRVEFKLTYDDLVEFTRIKKCVYCSSPIEWQMWSKGGKYNRAYYLDRKDNSQGYTKDNCVVCCTFCNMLRQDKLSHEEFMLLAPGLRKVAKSRLN